MEAPTLAERIESDLAAYDSVMTPDQVARVLHVTSKCVRDMCVDGRAAGQQGGEALAHPEARPRRPLGGGAAMRLPDKFKADLCFAVAAFVLAYGAIVLTAHGMAQGWW